MQKKVLVIAEKPSVALDLTKVLPGTFKRSKTHFESESHIVSYAVGHLVSLCYPEEIDQRFKKWQLSTLPILPDSFPLKGLPNTKSQLNALQTLIRRKDVGEIINACDAGREGELIFHYIIQHVWNNTVKGKVFKRLWLQSMTNDAIKQGFAELRDADDMAALRDTALCRSESDWLIGLNATRALTCFNSTIGRGAVTPCGRVQTPTLALIVNREKERLQFIPRSYSTLMASFSCEDDLYTGKWIDPSFKKNEQDPYLKKDRIWNQEKAAGIVNKCTGKPGKATETSKKSSQRAPQLYDLTSLQREANSRHGFSAKNTLSIAQALYEKHKVLTYPRTDSRFLPDDFIPTVTNTVKKQCSWQLKEFAKTVLDKNYIKNDKRIFNGKKVSDHHAIIPTTKVPGTLSDAEYKIYRMVASRFLAVFFPPVQYLVTKRLTVVEGETFLTEGKVLKDPGWKIIYGVESGKGKDKIIKPIPQNAQIQCKSVDQEQSETTPPARYTEATLLSAMEHSGKLIDDEELADAMKESGLGTPATRAAVIEKLIKDNYLIRDRRDLSPTGKALDLLSLIESMKIDVLSSPEMTGEWEYKLNQIVKGQFTRDEFMKEIRQLTERIINQVKDSAKKGQTRTETSFSPVQEMRFFETTTAYISADEKINIRKNISGRDMLDGEIIDLITGKTIGPFSEFISRKSGNQFSASLKLTDNKIEFIFANDLKHLDIDAITSTPPLGISPIDNTEIFETPFSYMSLSALNEDKKNGLTISKKILGKEILPHHVSQLLGAEKTELIKGFISKKKRPFDAFLSLNKSGKIEWHFPPRKAREKKT